MPRGGYRPGAGRPKKIRAASAPGVGPAAPPAFLAPPVVPETQPGNDMPLDYMLKVMNDPLAEDARRDRMAIAAAPYVHPKQDAVVRGKKDQAAEDAKTAGLGSDWGDDLAGGAPLN